MYFTSRFAAQEINLFSTYMNVDYWHIFVKKPDLVLKMQPAHLCRYSD